MSKLLQTADRKAMNKSELRERLVQYYRHHAPEKLDMVDDLVATRFSESSIITALSAKYGMDPASNTRLLPRFHAQSVSNVKWTDDDPEKANMESIAAAAAAAAASTRPGAARTQVQEAALKQQQQLQRDISIRDETQKLPPGGPLMTHLIINHFRSSQRSEVAEAFINEARLLGLSKRYYAEDDAPLDLDPATSALASVLFPASNSRFYVFRLQAEVPQKRRSTVAGRQPSLAVGEALDRMANESMWADIAFKQTKRRVYTSLDNSPVPRACPVNQLIETATRVVITPNVSVPEAVERQVDDLLERLLVTHQHYLSSPMLLAKLIERFFVPPHLPLQHKYDAHGIRIDVPPTERRGIISNAESKDEAEHARVEYLKDVTRTIQIKVLTVMWRWLSSAPADFDEAMMVTLATFLDENCYTPAIWSPCPSELTQLAEQLKLLLNTAWSRFHRRYAAHSGDENGAPDVVEFLRPMRSADDGLSGLDGNVHRAPTARGGAGPAPSLAPNAAAANLAGSSSAASPGAATFYFLRVDELALCEQIAAADHRAFRRIEPHEIHTFTAVSSAAMFQTSISPAANLVAFVRRGERLMNLAVCEIVTATPPDNSSNLTASKLATMTRDGGGAKSDHLSGKVDRDRGESFVSVRCQVISKIIALVYRFVELNDLFAAFSFYSALRHPAVTRLRGTWSQMPLAAMTSLEELHKIFAFEKGYRGYHDYANSVPDDDVYPLVPVIAVAVDEVRRLCASEPTVLKDALGTTVLHWRKFDVLGAILTEVRERQRSAVPVSFTLHAAFQKWIDGTMASAPNDPEELVRLSFAAEPPRASVGVE